MLEELMNFNEEKMPSSSEKGPKYKWKMKLSKSKEKSLYSKKFESIDDIEEEDEEKTLAEKVLQRQIDEKERLEEKKKKILKELHKKKKRLNLKKFLTREAGYEQKKAFNLEQKRFKELEKENKNFIVTPLLSAGTIELYKNEKLKKKPIYLRAKEILENRQKNLENLKIPKKRKIKGKKLNKSMDEINDINKKYIYIINNKIKDKKMTKKDIINYYKRQNDWKNKVNEKIAEKDIIKNYMEEKKYRLYFNPKICRGSEEIIMAMNEAKENYLNLTTETSNNNYFLTENTIPNQNYLNYDNDVFKRLYESKKIEKNNKDSMTFKPSINKNKYKNIMYKYKDISKISKNRDKKQNKKIKKKKGNSVDIKYRKIRNNKNEKEEKILKKENEAFGPWTNYLLKLKKNKSSEISYRLNIRQSSAWNENDVNIVPLKGESKEIIKDFL